MDYYRKSTRSRFNEQSSLCVIIEIKCRYLTNRKVRQLNQMKDLQKLIKLTGERAKLDAKANDTYIVYKNKDQIVKEYTNGSVIPVIDRDGSNG